MEFSGQDREGRAGTGADAPTSVGSPFLGREGGGGWWRRRYTAGRMQ